MAIWADILRVVHLAFLVYATIFAFRDLFMRSVPLHARYAYGWMIVCVTYIYLSDFAISGTEALYNSWYVMHYNVFAGEHVLLVVTILVTLLFVRLLSTFFRQPQSSDQPAELMAGTTLETVAVLLVVAYTLTLLVFYSFNIGAIIENSLMARDDRFADLRMMAEGEQNPLFALLTATQPAAIAIMGGALAERRRIAPLRILLFLVGVYLLFSQGSRTAFTIALLPGLIIYARRFRPFSRVMLFALFMALGLAVNGFIVQFRAGGLANYTSDELTFYYHQDNNFALVLHSLKLASTSPERTDAGATFAISLLNWVPRTIWPGKPSLADLDFGHYREPWWTIGYIGEMVSMFGPTWGIVGSIVYFLVMYVFLSMLLSSDGGRKNLAFKLMSLLYIYMCLRSMLNITQYVYGFLPFVLASLWTRSRSLIKHRPPASRAYRQR
ncbi:O-antigen polymerase [Ancylobacter mangrovi]|uniref:O-antigen polymerase n=1 Tax=Ancylobacter mangrovi TaxID=2972472 RepID=UPI0021632AAE|nr:O-antigen polymerase [Ancylobacter mangrovi]MCS0504865.1 oligosaccharide repeat unit polymerase [Ancylobacter mangrovi]